MSHARRIAGGLAALDMTRDDTVAVLMHHDPVYLSVVHACRMAGCRLRQISAHATREQIASALAEPGIRVLFTHEHFLPALGEAPEDITLIAVTPLALFPETAARHATRRCEAYHQWLSLQEERDRPLRAGRRGRRSLAQSAAVSGSTIGDSLRLLAALRAGADDRPPPEDEA